MSLSKSCVLFMAPWRSPPKEVNLTAQEPYKAANKSVVVGNRYGTAFPRSWAETLPKEVIFAAAAEVLGCARSAMK